MLRKFKKNIYISFKYRKFTRLIGAVFLCLIFTMMLNRNDLDKTNAGKLQGDGVTMMLNGNDLDKTNAGKLQVDGVTKRSNKAKFAYGFFAVTEAHLIAALVNIRRLKLKRSFNVGEKKQVDFVVLTNVGLSKGTEMSTDIKLIKYLKLPSPRGYYVESMVKLLLFNMTDYNRIIYMDVDALVLKSLDELFDLPSSVFLASPVAYWENELCFTAALLVIQPNHKTWLQIFKRMNSTLKDRKYDMDLINEFYGRRITASFKLYPEILLLPGNFLILSSHFRDTRQSYYKEYGAIFKDINSLANETYIVHFSGQQKPWDLSRQSILSYKAVSKYFYDFNLAFKDEYEAIQNYQNITG